MFASRFRCWRSGPASFPRVPRRLLFEQLHARRVLSSMPLTGVAVDCCDELPVQPPLQRAPSDVDETGLTGSKRLDHDSGFQGGVRVAAGDVNGDGRDDVIVGAGPGFRPHVSAFDAATGETLHRFFAFHPGFSGGVFVAAGDINQDTFADIIVGADAGGGPHVRVFSGVDGSLLTSFFAYDVNFTGGVRVAAGDVNQDGTPDIITAPGPGGGPHIKVFSGTDLTEISSFFAFDRAFQGGVFVAAGDFDQDGADDLITGAGAGGGPHVRVFNVAQTEAVELFDFFAYDPAFTGGVRVAAGDVNRDGLVDIVTAPGPGGGPHVRAFDGRTGNELISLFAYDREFTGGVFVASGDVNGDGHDDIITGAGAGGPHVRVFSGADGSLLLDRVDRRPGFGGGLRVLIGVPNSRAPSDRELPPFDLFPNLFEDEKTLEELLLLDDDLAWLDDE